MKANTRQTYLVDTIRARLDRPVVLTGLMGAGKTRIGRSLARALELPFVDSDAEIEAAARSTIAEIFERDGEPFFRDAERRVIARLLEVDSPQVVATGGGAFTSVDTLNLVKEKAISVWLRVDLEVLAQRMRGDRSRPLLAGGDAGSVLRDLAEKRYHLYAQADIIVDSKDVSVGVTLQKVLEKLDEYLN